MKQAATASTHGEILAQYQQYGYAVIPDALSADDLTYLNDLVESDLVQNPADWHAPSQGASGNGNILMRYPELDRIIRHPRVFPVLQTILRDEARFAQVDFRDVTGEYAESSAMNWHRDISYYGTIGGKTWDPLNPYRSTNACVIYYLKDVHECCPSFTLVPNSHEYSSMEEAKAKLGEQYEEIQFRGKAGTAILYNITEFHTRSAGTAECSHGRRTLHNYHSRESQPPLTDWATVPEQLALSSDPDTRDYYSKWTPAQIKFARRTYNQPIPTYYPPLD